MTNTMEVIVYRNPYEAMMWDSLRNNPEFFLAFAAIAFVFVVTSIIVDKLFRYFSCNKWKRAHIP